MPVGVWGAAEEVAGEKMGASGFEFEVSGDGFPANAGFKLVADEAAGIAGGIADALGHPGVGVGGEQVPTMGPHELNVLARFGGDAVAR